MIVTGPAQRAHLRLISKLPVRTHEANLRVIVDEEEARMARERVYAATVARQEEARRKQRLVLELAAQGMRNIEIVERLNLSSATVSRHRRGEGLAMYRRQA